MTLENISLRDMSEMAKCVPTLWKLCIWILMASKAQCDYVISMAFTKYHNHYHLVSLYNSKLGNDSDFGRSVDDLVPNKKKHL